MAFRSAIAEIFDKKTTADRSSTSSSEVALPNLVPETVGESSPPHTPFEHGYELETHDNADADIGLNSNTAREPHPSTPDAIRTGNCWSCRRALWWRDRLGNKKCGICHPPSNPDQVGWYDDHGEQFEERAAILEYEAGLPRDLAEAQARTNETAP